MLDVNCLSFNIEIKYYLFIYFNIDDFKILSAKFEILYVLFTENMKEKKQRYVPFYTTELFCSLHDEIGQQFSWPKR